MVCRDPSTDIITKGVRGREKKEKQFLTGKESLIFDYLRWSMLSKYSQLFIHLSVYPKLLANASD